MKRRAKSVFDVFIQLLANVVSTKTQNLKQNIAGIKTPRKSYIFAMISGVSAFLERLSRRLLSKFELPHLNSATNLSAGGR